MILGPSDFKHCAEYRFDDYDEARRVTRSIRRYFEKHYIGGWLVSQSELQVLVCTNEDSNKFFKMAFMRMGRIPAHITL